MEIKKNQVYIVEIMDNGYQGEGIAKIDNIPVFVNGTIKGETVKIQILKVNASHAYGKLLEIVKKSEYRIEEDCLTYSKCGGCQLRHMKYDYTLQLKRKIVENCLYKSLQNKIAVNHTLGMEKPLYYRNKLQYPVGINGMGVYATRTHTIIPVEHCCIQNKKCQEVANEVYTFLIQNKVPAYNESTLTGKVRHIIVKMGIQTNEIMLVLVLNDEKLECAEELVKYVTNKFSDVKTIIKNINNKNTNVILGKKNVVLYGDGYIKDVLGGFTFKIAANSFYQVNPIQTEKLYQTAIRFADLDKDDIVYDLYCGIGTISIFLASKVQKVYGIEIVSEAIIAAKENAILNNIMNTKFMVGEVQNVLPQLVKEKKADVIFVDPPRRGLDGITVNTILNVEPKKIVYISCNPATLARDLKLLEGKYEIKQVQPIDMFPYTSHVECVCVLKRRQTIINKGKTNYSVVTKKR